MSASLQNQVARVAGAAAYARQRMVKAANPLARFGMHALGALGGGIAGGVASGGDLSSIGVGAAGGALLPSRRVGNFARGLVGAPAKLPAGVTSSAMHAAGSHWLPRTAVGLGGAYGLGYGTYHGLGYGKPVDPAQQFGRYRELTDRLHDQYEADISAVSSGRYNPHTGQRDGDWYSYLFGFQGLSPAEKAQQVEAMRAKLEAARAGTGTLGAYRGNQPGLSGYGENATYDTIRQQALAASQAGLNQADTRPGLFRRMMFDGTPRVVSDDAQTAMKAFIEKYGPKPTVPKPVASRFSYIGGRPYGPVDFSHLGAGTGFGHDYSGYYQPQSLVAPR